MPILKEYREKVGHLIDKDIWNSKYSPVEIDEETKELTIKSSGRYRGSVRISSGLFYTDEEWETQRKEILKLELP